ncbi:cobalamin biosynthesis protein [Nocardia panacis]|uniref:Cobalamin biosynthesis protein n=1 Tax=Nocardia panacis TaxID=2340916 RepID=A0A3A4KQK2_9NOCA|nr:cobalamin biosynthesis protein [Nocardia panacis]RJO75290.1 cobalamin biosynthesis protein [Nocardia panacis]
MVPCRTRTTSERGHSDPEPCLGKTFGEPVAVGIGFRPGASAERIIGAVREVVGDSVINCLATLDHRATEPGLRCAAAQLGVPVLTYSATELARVEVDAPSAATLGRVGTPSVAEAAARLAGGRLLTPKRIVGYVTVAVAQGIPSAH